MISLIQSLLKLKILPIFWSLLVFGLCVIPSDKAATVATSNDKLNHIFAFSAFVFLWLFHSKHIILIISIGIVYGVFIEIIQYLLPVSFHRGFEILDIAADAIGCILGLIIYKLFNQFLNNNNIG